jgi:hypothetical protein
MVLNEQMRHPMSAQYSAADDCLAITDAPAGVRITIYENVVPPFVESAIEQLYQNLYASLVWLKIRGIAERLSTYVVTDNGRPLAILLFRIDGTRAVVINNVIEVREAEIGRFASAVFTRFGRISVISFKTIETDLRQLEFPYRRFNTSENIVLTLPRSSDDYIAALGKNTRKNVRYYLNRVKRFFPSFEYKLLERETVEASQVIEILRLKNNRMPGAMEDAETRRILALVAARGMVGIITIDGKICAGSIGYRIGNHTFGSVLAHDLQYDGYWIGMLCCFLTICESIGRGCREYHFLWGPDDYKFRMLGAQRDLDDVVVYRSARHVVLNPVVACTSIATRYTRVLRLRLRETGKPEHRIGKMMAALVQWRLKMRERLSFRHK